MGRRFTSCSISFGNISHLDDEVGYDAVDRGVLVVQCLLERNQTCSLCSRELHSI